jgi:hypothetical protein
LYTTRHHTLTLPLPCPPPPLTPTPTQGILDPTLELAKLQKKAGEASGRIEALRKKMGMPGYGDKTPAGVQADDSDRLARAEAELTAAQQHMEDMRTMIAEQQQQQQK